ncbi:esterase [Nocardia cyriacigeorgica]|uniref:alpha/beta hydrolase n=1 Tax=Nocardia cyriacigeorgica TaxID=135487 RepID=UPI0018943563|nr:alpha/beta hydrolase-fold protein [Nocardia cyriacigeorgica]MBF6517886.1 esterase [Nocardia cyriacigeorgica]
MSVVSTWSLLSGPLPVALTLAAVAGLAWLLTGRRAPASRTVAVCAIAAVAITAGGAYLVRSVLRLIPDALGMSVYACVGLGVFAVLLAGAHVVRRPGSARMAAVAVTATVVLTACANQINQAYDAYPTLGAALGTQQLNEVPFGEIAAPQRLRPDVEPVEQGWVPPPGLPTEGRLTRTPIPGAVSGFQARRAEIYLPPAYFADPRPQLPVLVLLAGQPGSPRDWATSGGLPATMDAFARAHQGLAPIVVVADGTGSTWNDPLCADGPHAEVATYLATDVPNWIRAHLSVDPDPQAWAIGGLSYGGTCALQLAAGYPQVYPTFLAMSAEADLNLADREHTLGVFDGDTAAYARANPHDLLAGRRYPGSAGIFVVGSDDTETLPGSRRAYADARDAGMAVGYLELPGGHDWRVWSTGLARELPWVAQRIGLIAG